MSISDNAKRHIERSRADRARTYDTLLKQYRHDNSSSILATFNMASSCLLGRDVVYGRLV